VVGEVRDKKGNYIDFVGDTVQAFRDAGLALLQRGNPDNRRRLAADGVGKRQTCKNTQARMVQRYSRLYLILILVSQKMNQVSFDYPNKLHPSFVNLQTNQYDTIIWEGGRGGAKSEALAALGYFRIIY
jgi:hypothetical protein